MTPAEKLQSSSILAAPGDNCRHATQLFAETLDPVFRTTLATPPRLERFRAGLDSYFMGPALFLAAEMRGTTYTFARDQRRIAQTGFDLIFLQMAIEGTDRRTVNDETMLVEPGDITMFDLSRPLRAETENCRNLTLVLPRHILFSNDTQNDALHGMRLKRSTSSARLIGSHLRALHQDLGSITQAEAPAIIHATANLVTNLVGPQIGMRSSTSPATRGAVIMEIKRYIGQNLAQADLGPDHLCKAFGLSRASLYRLFEPIGGVTDHIRTRRLRSAFDMLFHDQKRTIGEIAYACGFTDVSAFSRAFRHQFDMSPTEVRDGGHERPIFPHVSHQQSAASVRDWLRIISAL
jgi:AraC-like DNA-binding protein